MPQDKTSIRTENKGDVHVILTDGSDDVAITGGSVHTLENNSGAVLTAVGGLLTDTQLRAAPVPVTDQHDQPLTDTQLRADPVSVIIESIAGTPKAEYLASGALAATSEETLETADIGTGTTGTLRKVTVSSDVPWRAEIQKFNGTAATTIAMLHGEAGSTHAFDAEAKSALFQQAGGTGNTFRVVVRNNNTSGIGANGAVHATVEWAEE